MKQSNGDMKSEHKKTTNRTTIDPTTNIISGRQSTKKQIQKEGASI